MGADSEEAPACLPFAMPCGCCRLAACRLHTLLPPLLYLIPPRIRGVAEALWRETGGVGDSKHSARLGLSVSVVKSCFCRE